MDAGALQVRFVLTIRDVIIEGDRIGTVTVDWLSETDRAGLAAISQTWLKSSRDFTRELTGLSDFGNVSLMMENR